MDDREADAIVEGERDQSLTRPGEFASAPGGDRAEMYALQLRLAAFAMA